MEVADVGMDGWSAKGISHIAYVYVVVREVFSILRRSSVSTLKAVFELG